MKKTILKATKLALLCGSVGLMSTAAVADLNLGSAAPICATPKTAAKVQKTYETVTGAPLAVVSRMADVVEVQVATGLPKESRVSIAATPQIVKKVWSSMDAWGRDAAVRLVFTMGGGHVLDFPSLIPITQADLDDGWIDIYADDGKGVHGHMWLERITSIHAVEIPGKDGVNTRTISFYGHDGKLIMGVYASISTKKFDQASVDGFYKTRALMASMEQLCS